MSRVAAFLVAGGVAMAVGDGNEFDNVDCGVAAKPPGREIRKAESGKAGKRKAKRGKGWKELKASPAGSAIPERVWVIALLPLYQFNIIGERAWFFFTNFSHISSGDRE